MQTGHGDLDWIANYIWGIADDVLRDLYVRGKYPRRHPPHDRAAPARCGPGRQQAGGSRHEGFPRRGGGGRAGPGPAPSGGTGFLQHLEVHLARPPGPRQPPAAHRRLRGLARRVLAERAGHPGELRVPQPDPAALPRRRPGHPDREARLARRQPEPRAGDEHRRLGAPSRTRQPRHGVDLRRAGSALQRGEQRGGGRTLDPARRGGAHGAAPLPPRRRRGSSPAPTCSTTAPAAPAAC